MPRAQRAAIVVAGVRVVYGAALVAAPARTTRSWIGPDGSRPAAQVAIRGLGAREIFLHVGAIVAALGHRPVRPWLAASIAGDCADVAATVVSGAALPDGAASKTAAVAGGSAAISAVVLALLAD